MACALAAMTAMGTAPAIAGAATAGWTVQPSPTPAGAVNAGLAAVACSSAQDCWAVGDYATTTSNDFTLAEHWNGSGWSIVTTPNVHGATFNLLSGVSCAGPDLCIAVGFSETSTHHGVVVRVLAEAWNGKTWAIQPTAPAGSNPSMTLAAVSCTAPNSCTGVGSQLKSLSGQNQPLAEHWNGTAWTVQPTPNPHAENGSGLTGVSCTASNACSASGELGFADAEQFIFAMRWNGTTWAMQKQPNPAGMNLNSGNSVSCASATACDIVGSWEDRSGPVEPLAQGWNGTAWSGQAPPSPKGNQIGGLNGVSCPAVASCIAVGNWADNVNSNPELTLAEQWNGTAWTIQPTPNPATAKISHLNGVACTSATACVAVGAFWNGTVTQTLTEIYTRG